MTFIALRGMVFESEMKKILQDEGISRNRSPLQPTISGLADRTRTIIPRHRGIDAKFSKQTVANHSEEVIKLIKLIHLWTNEN